MRAPRTRALRVGSMVLAGLWLAGAGLATAPRDEERAQGAWTSAGAADAPVVSAAARGDAAQVISLLEAGEDPNQADAAGVTALMLAASADDLEAVKQLLSHGAQLEQVDSDARSALMWAASFGRVEAVRTLVAAGASLERTGPYGLTALVFAVGGGHEEAAEALLAAGADAKAGYKDGTSAVSAAARRGDTGIFIALKKAGADPWVANSGEVNALMAAAAEGHGEIVRHLLADEKRRLDAQSTRGWTALHYAVVGNHVDTVRRLLAAKADTTLVDDLGRSAADWARALGNDTVVLLEEAQGSDA